MRRSRCINYEREGNRERAMGLGLVRVELGERERERLDLMLTHTTQKHMNKHGLSLSHTLREIRDSIVAPSLYLLLLSLRAGDLSTILLL